jgi:hypothetical protein
MKGTRTMPVSKRRRPAPEPDTTLLEYVAERLMGPPSRRGGSYGESYWCCPFHADDSPSFHTLPHREGERDFWRCFGCGSYGDIRQLMRGLRQRGHPECRGSWDPDHKAKVAQWEREWCNLNASTEAQRSGGAGARGGLGTAPTGATVAERFPSVESVESDPLTGGLGGSTDPFDVEEAYRNASPRAVESLVQAFVLARTAGVDLVALCRFAWRQEMEWVRWLRDFDKRCLRDIRCQ